MLGLIRSGSDSAMLNADTRNANKAFRSNNYKPLTAVTLKLCQMSGESRAKDHQRREVST
ncbi:hypothetical protein Daesc_006668 [Daldinia eschscholtzii]|uniref:Uncharacterized protein n=1 Tax=Daldinia eschscholtzii TaxID=292717 RepID=A0AAX6MI58_9PEZI